MVEMYIPVVLAGLAVGFAIASCVHSYRTKK